MKLDVPALLDLKDVLVLKVHAVIKVTEVKTDVTVLMVKTDVTVLMVRPVILDLQVRLETMVLLVHKVHKVRKVHKALPVEAETVILGLLGHGILPILLKEMFGGSFKLILAKFLN